MKKAESTKNEILSSTLKLLRMNGDATVKEISDDAGVNIAAINYHFTDKSTLISVVVRRILNEFKGKVDIYINTNPRTEEDIVNDIKRFFDDLYQFAVDNTGIIKYVLAPQNKQLLDMTNKFFYSIFSVDSEFTHKIISRIGAYSPSQSAEELKAKYMLLFSSLALPLLFRLDLFDHNGVTTMFPLQDPELKKSYIEQLARIILE